LSFPSFFVLHALLHLWINIPQFYPESHPKLSEIGTLKANSHNLELTYFHKRNCTPVQNMFSDDASLTHLVSSSFLLASIPCLSLDLMDTWSS